METEQPPDDCNCLVLRQAARRVTQLYERYLGAVGLTTAQFSIISKIARYPGVTTLELAEQMVMDRTTLVRAVKPLQREGLVLASKGPGAGRTHVLSLTVEGQIRYTLARESWRAAQAEFERRFGAARAESVREELRAIAV
ncbi:MarR family winged helix-turn-helix transcriptional regulator [Caballeronia grimmiae]|nr:MarR family winged helix-turn-helix transcriptional regulator [Caballeronia grimmiae]KDR26594.1 MarR family transcriptional regulator [Caballeronia grimmiae]